VLVVEKMLGSTHDRFGFSYVGFDFDVFIEERCDYGTEVYKFVDVVEFFLLGSRMSSGSVLLLKSILACLRDDGKNIASDFDLILSEPRCMMSPKQAK
jgi:hypothetical protein